MSVPDDQAVADYSRANRGSEGALRRFAKPFSGHSERSVTGSSQADSRGGFRGGADVGAAGAAGTGSGVALARAILLVAGLAGALALVAADLSTLYEVRVGNVVVGRVIGHHQHDWALLLLGLACLPMLVGALRGAVPAMLAVFFIGLAALFAGPIGDRSDVGTAGLIGDAYAGATAHASAGYRLETAGAILLLLCGGGLALLSARQGWRPQVRVGPRRRPARARRDSAGPEAGGPEAGGGLAPNPYAEEDAG